jgi:hypothetical protein
MAIYLDTNVMYDWRTFAEADRLALVVLARELNQPVVVPSLVADELEASLRRRLRDAADEFDALADKLRSLFQLEYVETEPSLAEELVVEPWRAALGEGFDACEVTAEDALAGLQREIAGAPPALRTSPSKPGTGGRDAAIWHAIVRNHLTREENGFFITRDVRGFMAEGRLRDELQADLAGCDRPLTVLPTIEDFLMGLGTKADVEVDVAEVGPRVVELAREGLREARGLARAVFDRDHAEFEFRTWIGEGEVLRVVRAQRFDGQFGEVLLVDCECRLKFRIDYRHPPADPNDRTWYGLDGLDARGRVQAYLGSDRAGRFIAAQLKPLQSVWITGERLMMTTRINGE